MSLQSHSCHFPSSYPAPSLPSSQPFPPPPRRPLPPPPPNDLTPTSPLMTTMATTYTHSHRHSMGSDSLPSSPLPVPRSRSTTSLPLSNPSSSMGRRISTSTVTKKSKMQRIKKSNARPSTAPGPKSSNPYGSPPPPPSAFTGKAGWLKRVTKFGSSSSLVSNDKDGRASMANTFSSSHSVLSYDDDVDDFGSTAAADLDFISAVTTTAPLHPPASRSSILLGNNNNGHGEKPGERGEKMYDFLQALEIAPTKPIVPQRSRSRAGSVKQAPPLIDLTGGMYTRGNINRPSALPLYRTTPLPPPPVVHFALPSSSSQGSSDNSPAGSTSTVARTLVDSRSRSSSGESSSNAKVRPSKPVTAATRATANDAKVQRPAAPASPAVPVVLPITSKPKLTTRKRAPTPPEPTARVTSSTIPASRSTSSLPRSVSSPAVPDSSLQKQSEPKVEEAALAEILKEVTLLLPAPPKAIHAPTSDPGLYLTWTSVRKVVLRAPPLTPDMQNDEGVAFPSSPSATVQGVTNKEDAQPSDNASPSETTDVTALMPPVPEPVLPRTPERAFVKSPRRQPQTPTTPTPSSPNLQVQAPIPSSMFCPPPPPAPSTPKAEESSSSDSPSHSPPPPQTPPKRPLSAASSSSSDSDTSFHTATTKPTPISRPSSPRVPEPPATLCPTGAPPPPPEEPSTTSRARQRTTDTTLASSSDSASVYEKTLAAISPEDIHISQRTLLEPVVRKASDVSLKQLFKELERTELSPSVATDIDGHSDGGSGRPKKRSLNSLTGAVVGGVVGGVSGKKASRKRPATANAAVDLTKIKTPVSSPVLSVTNFHASGSLNPSSVNGAARSLGAAAAANTTTTANAGDVSPASSSRPPISTRRPRTATEPRQTRLEFALDSGRASPGKALDMNWDRDANPWDHPTFRSEGSVFKDPSSAPRTRAKSEASPQAASSASSTLTVKKESKRMSMSMRRPSTADSAAKKLLSKKSLQAIFTGSGSEQQQPTPSMPSTPPSPTPTRRRSIASSSGPPTSFSATLKRSFTIRSNKSKHKGKEKELPPVPAPQLPVVLDNSEEASSAAAAASPDPSPSAFDSDRMLTMRDIYEASLIPIWDKDGHKVTFGKLFEDQVTIVVFIRHFWCPMCQDYMKSIAKDLEPGRLAQARVKLIVIGCGDPGMIRSYNDKIVKSPFEMYTDPKLLLFTALGMTLKTTDGGSEEHKGNYVKHGTLRGTLAVIGRALFSMSPGVMVKKGGDVKQLGGEFVLGPGLRCRFAHRMTTTRNHAPIRDVAITAGVSLVRSPTLSRHLKTPSEEADWAARRKASTKKKALWRSSVADVLPPPPQAHLSSSICGDECPVQTNHLVGTI